MANQAHPQTPGEMIKALLKQRGWTQGALALITGRSERSINEIVRGRAGVSPEMAACLAAAFGNTPETWMQLETTYRLSLISPNTSEIEKRATLFSRGPIPEMQRRGWIKTTDDVDDLDRELTLFFGHGNAAGRPLSVATRRTDTLPDLTPSESAWCFRAKQLAATLLATPFSETRLPKLKNELRKLASHPKEARYLSRLLADYGIRFVVVEPLAGVKIDGAAFWHEIGPVIAVTIRHDRIDGFWFTVMHEMAHILHGDPISVDRGMVDAEEGVLVRLVRNEAENRADQEAAASLIPAKEIDSFIGRIGPLYSRDRVIQFANRIHIHPGIIVGQLQYRKEIGYRSLRDQLVKIRDVVISAALTDGWGQAISPSVTRRAK